MSFFSKLWGAIGACPSAAGPVGYRAYAVGDIHGRLDLLDMMLTKIAADIASRRPATNLVIFLGDLIDRGPQSAQVVERLRTWQLEGVRTIFLCGNHEEILLRVLSGELGLVGSWLKYGGVECLESYGLPAGKINGCSEVEALAMINRTIPSEHQEFLSTFSDTLRFGDYLFVHAGIRPGLKLSDQVRSDLRWIREPFLEDSTDHGVTVVHGHTITEGVDQRPNRVGLDTGAYRSGVLTAMAIEGRERWFLDTAAGS